MTTLPKINRRGWLALWSQDRRRHRRAPVLRAQYPDKLAWAWDFANPYKWNVWMSSNEGASWLLIEGYWMYGEDRLFAPDGGGELYYIVGVDEFGNEVTGHSNVIRPADAPPPVTLLTDLAAYWSLDETDVIGDLERADQLGRTPLSPSGTEILSTTGVVNNGAEIIGGGYALLGSATQLSLAGDFSVSVWVYLNVYYNWQVAFHLYDSGNALECFRLQEYGPSNGADNDIFVLLGSDGGFINCQPATDQWHHFVVAVSGSVMRIYHNGAWVDEVTLAGGARPQPDEVRIGGNQLWYGWAGPLDEVGFWNRALSAAEVSQLYNAGDGLAYALF